MRQVLSLLFLALQITFVSAQQIMRTGTPLVQQFTKNNYNAGNQNWSVAVANDGIIYVGNTEGLLSFDGHYWKLHPLKNKSTVRSVQTAADGKIYTGGFREFGYWERKPSGKLHYHSLSNLVSDKELLLNDEIWKIILQGNKVYFHAFSKCYVYNVNDRSIQWIKAKGEPFLFPHQVEDRIYFEQIPSGLHLWQNDKLQPIKGRNELSNKNVLALLPYDSTKFLLATARHGLYFLGRDGSVQAWKTEASDKLERGQINNGIYLYEDQYAFGTIQDGVIIINKKGELVQHINKNNGLQNNTVLGIAKDKQNNIWVGLDNGIDRIEINSPIYFYSDITGNIGTVYTSIIHRNKIYLGTNQGLFSSPWKDLNNYNALNFTIVPNSSGQVWSLAIINDQLLCGHNDGTFMVNSDGMQKLSAITGGWTFETTPNNSYVLQGNYTGIAKFDVSNGIEFVKRFQEIKEPVRQIRHKNGNEYWISDNRKVDLVSFDQNFDRVDTKTSTIADSTLNEVIFYGAYPLENNIIFTSDSGLFYYDDIIKKFQAHEVLNSKLGNFRYANKIIRKSPGQYWFINRSRIAQVRFADDGLVSVDSISMNPLRNRMMNFYENIIPSGDAYIIGLDNGFAIYKENNGREKSAPPAPIISQVWNIQQPNQIFDADEVVIPYQTNSLRIAFASPYYCTSPLSYQYQLEGHSGEWSVWDESAYKDFTNLSFGKYTLRLRARNAEGLVSEVSEFSFVVETPWYFRWYAWVLYIALLGWIAYQGIQRYKTHQQRKQYQLRRRLLEQQQEAIARKNELNEQQYILLKNKQLQKELEIKNRELANAATNIIYKNEMLNNLHAQLKELKDPEGNKLSSEELRKINKLIEDAHNDNRDWDIFEKSFNEAHGDFFKKIKAEYPELVPNDLKLCAYLRLNMTSKEIAALLNITTRGVEIRRYRLRKKLGIPTEKNLTEFLLER